MTLRTHKTRIVATIGPASDTPERQEAMIRAGVDIARLNFSHGSFEEHGRRITSLRKAARAAGRDLAILADLPGPKIRLGELAHEPVELETGGVFTLTTRPIVGDGERASVGLETLPERVRPGDRLFLNDGFVQLAVTAVRPPEITCRVVAGGEIRSRKGVNFPGIDLGLPAFTDHDRACLEFALSCGVDAVSQSFVESADDVRVVREAAAGLGCHPLVVAKIERSRALDNVEGILEASDGVMIARGDLGVEVPIERMAVLQKELIRQAVRLGKPVITATQMLESMTRSPQPTRAEATDVANAILDGTDAVMLSGESATGRYPVEAVETLARIAASTEPHRSRTNLWDRLRRLPARSDADPADLLTLAVEAVLAASPAAAVIVPTSGGYTARSLARLRLPIWIGAATPEESICRRLLFSYGVEPVHADPSREDWGAFTRKFVAERKLPGSLALLIQGPSPAHPDVFHRLELIPIRERGEA